MIPIDRYVQTQLLNTSEEDFSAALKKFNISEEYMNDSVDIIKKWYNQQPHLPPLTYADNSLRRWLGHCKFSVERAKTQIDNMHLARGQIPEFFEGRDPMGKRMQDAMSMIQVVIQPHLTKDNYRIVHVMITEPDADKYDPELCYTYLFALTDMSASIDSNEGDIVIVDFQSFTLKHFLKTTPACLKKLIFVAQECYAARIKGIHVLNLPSYGEFTLNIIKSLVKSKIRDRIHVHRTYEDLYHHYPKESFPNDIGGDEQLTRKEISDLWKKHMTSSTEWRKWLIESSNTKSDESKRPTADVTASISGAICGSGTFRKLEID